MRHRQHEPLTVLGSQLVIDVTCSTVRSMVLPYVDNLARYARIDANRFERASQTVERESCVAPDWDAERLEDLCKAISRTLRADMMITEGKLSTCMRSEEPTGTAMLYTLKHSPQARMHRHLPAVSRLRFIPGTGLDPDLVGLEVDVLNPQPDDLSNPHAREGRHLDHDPLNVLYRPRSSSARVHDVACRRRD